MNACIFVCVWRIWIRSVIRSSLHIVNLNPSSNICRINHARVQQQQKRATLDRIGPSVRRLPQWPTRIFCVYIESMVLLYAETNNQFMPTQNKMNAVITLSAELQFGHFHLPVPPPIVYCLEKDAWNPWLCFPSLWWVSTSLPHAHFFSLGWGEIHTPSPCLVLLFWEVQLINYDN